LAWAGALSTLLLLLSAKTWMPTAAFGRDGVCVGMAVRGVDRESELLACGRFHSYLLAEQASEFVDASEAPRQDRSNFDGILVVAIRLGTEVDK
jgi:hypothetical protein